VIEQLQLPEYNERKENNNCKFNRRDSKGKLLYTELATNTK